MSRVAILGAGGRMGSALQANVDGSGLTLHAALDRDDDIAVALPGCAVYIDFSSPAATLHAAKVAHGLRLPAVVGTTGLDADGERALAELAAVAPIVVAANFALGVNVLIGLVAHAARALGPSWDAEIVEAHHRHKVDAPSGTALALVQAIADGRGTVGARLDGRSGTVGARPIGEVGVHAVRGGDVIGEHTVLLLGDGERLELTHRATDRAIFARGALRAAAWVVGKPPGRYDMQDVLGLRLALA